MRPGERLGREVVFVGEQCVRIWSESKKGSGTSTEPTLPLIRKSRMSGAPGVLAQANQGVLTHVSNGARRGAPGAGESRGTHPRLEQRETWGTRLYRVSLRCQYYKSRSQPKFCKRLGCRVRDVRDPGEEGSSFWESRRPRSFSICTFHESVRPRISPRSTETGAPGVRSTK